MQAVQTADRGLFHGRSPYDGVRRVVAFRRLARYPLYIAFGQGYPTILLGWYRNLALYGLAALLAASALVLVIRYALRALVAQQDAVLSLRMESERRKRAETDLAHARKLEAIGALTSGIAHDFGNFLQVVMLNLQVLKGRQPDERLEGLVRASLEASRRAAALRARILAFSRKQPLSPEPVDINAVIQKFLPILAHALGSTIRIETELADDLWPTVLDEGQLEVALLNLAVNAKHAMAGSGVLSIMTSNLALGPGEAVDNVAGDLVSVAVADTGTGMPQDVAAKAFEPFFTTKEEGSGTGLGLAAVLGFARASDGTATIDSVLGQGTIVKLYFPRAPGFDAANDRADQSTAAE
jgi:signal transduction histidine kinase